MCTARGVGVEEWLARSVPEAAGPAAMPVSARPVLTSHARGAQLFAVVPLSSLGVGPEVTNNMCKCPTPPSRPPMRRAVQFVPYGSCPRTVRVPDFTPAPPRVPVHPALLRFPAQLRRWFRDLLPAWPGRGRCHVRGPLEDAEHRGRSRPGAFLLSGCARAATPSMCVAIIRARFGHYGPLGAQSLVPMLPSPREHSDHVHQGRVPTTAPSSGMPYSFGPATRTAQVRLRLVICG